MDEGEIDVAAGIQLAAAIASDGQAGHGIAAGLGPAWHLAGDLAPELPEQIVHHPGPEGCDAASAVAVAVGDSDAELLLFEALPVTIQRRGHGAAAVPDRHGLRHGLPGWPDVRPSEGMRFVRANV